MSERYAPRWLYPADGWVPRAMSPEALLGVPVVPSTLVPIGQWFTTGTLLFVGIPATRTHTEALGIVRRGLADVLAHLGEAPVPLWLEVAESYWRNRSQRAEAVPS